jgi:hypothetical protein
MATAIIGTAFVCVYVAVVVAIGLSVLGVNVPLIGSLSRHTRDDRIFGIAMLLIALFSVGLFTFQGFFGW